MTTQKNLWSSDFQPTGNQTTESIMERPTLKNTLIRNYSCLGSLIHLLSDQFSLDSRESLIMIVHLFDSLSTKNHRDEQAEKRLHRHHLFQVDLPFSACSSFLYLKLCPKLLEFPLELKGSLCLQGAFQRIRKVKYIANASLGKSAALKAAAQAYGH